MKFSEHITEMQGEATCLPRIVSGEIWRSYPQRAGGMAMGWGNALFGLTVRPEQTVSSNSVQMKQKPTLFGSGGQF